MAKSFAWRNLLFASLVLCAPATAAERGTFTPACAERDLRAVTLIEQQGGEASMASDVLAEAGLTLLQARLNCLAGDEAGGVSSHPRN